MTNTTAALAAAIDRRRAAYAELAPWTIIPRPRPKRSRRSCNHGIGLATRQQGTTMRGK